MRVSKHAEAAAYAWALFGKNRRRTAASQSLSFRAKRGICCSLLQNRFLDPPRPRNDRRFGRIRCHRGNPLLLRLHWPEAKPIHGKSAGNPFCASLGARLGSFRNTAKFPPPPAKPRPFRARDRCRGTACLVLSQVEAPCPYGIGTALGRKSVPLRPNAASYSSPTPPVE